MGVVDRDVSALASELDGDRLADAHTSAGYQRLAAHQGCGHWMSNQHSRADAGSPMMLHGAIEP